MSSTETATSSAPLDRLAGLLAEHAELEAALADQAVHADQSRARRLGRVAPRSNPRRDPAPTFPAPGQPPSGGRSWDYANEQAVS